MKERMDGGAITIRGAKEVESEESNRLRSSMIVTLTKK